MKKIWDSPHIHFDHPTDLIGTAKLDGNSLAESLPENVVVGSQSPREFFARGTGGVTTRPTIVRLRPCDEGQPSNCCKISVPECANFQNSEKTMWESNESLSSTFDFSTSKNHLHKDKDCDKSTSLHSLKVCDHNSSTKSSGRTVCLRCGLGFPGTLFICKRPNLSCSTRVSGKISKHANESSSSSLEFVSSKENPPKDKKKRVPHHLLDEPDFISNKESPPKKYKTKFESDFDVMNETCKTKVQKNDNDYFINLNSAIKINSVKKPRSYKSTSLPLRQFSKSVVASSAPGTSTEKSPYCLRTTNCPFSGIAANSSKGKVVLEFFGASVSTKEPVTNNKGGGNNVSDLLLKQVSDNSQNEQELLINCSQNSVNNVTDIQPMPGSSLQFAANELLANSEISLSKNSTDSQKKDTVKENVRREFALKYKKGPVSNDSAKNCPKLRPRIARSNSEQKFLAWLKHVSPTAFTRITKNPENLEKLKKFVFKGRNDYIIAANELLANSEISLSKNSADSQKKDTVKGNIRREFALKYKKGLVSNDSAKNCPKLRPIIAQSNSKKEFLAGYYKWLKDASPSAFTKFTENPENLENLKKFVFTGLNDDAIDFLLKRTKKS